MVVCTLFFALVYFTLEQANCNFGAKLVLWSYILMMIALMLINF